MHLNSCQSLISILAFSLMMLAGCNSSSSSDTGSTDNGSTDTGSTDTGSTGTASSAEALNVDNFVAGALASAEIEDCTLSDGTETTCYRIEAAGKAQGQTIGPFCPRTTSSTAAETGIWISADSTAQVYDADGDFILNLANLYNDTAWNGLHNDDGSVNVTLTEAACDGAAQPNVEDQYKYHCVECSTDYLDDGAIAGTYVIPVTPTPADTTSSVAATVGVALNGSELSGPAPVDAILANYTIAAFDDCGGHINLHQGYHYHAATGCTEVGAQDDGHAGLIGYAMDGYGIYGMKDADGNEESLDECRGTTDDTRGYHYHAASAGENMFIGCNHGKTVATTTAGGPPGGGPPNGGPNGTAPTR